jgi:hypothetical protein
VAINDRGVSTSLPTDHAFSANELNGHLVLGVLPDKVSFLLHNTGYATEKMQSHLAVLPI